MISHRTILVALLAAVPLATADGYDASVDYLGSDTTGCDSSSDYDWSGDHTGNWSWYNYRYHDRASCEDDFDYVDVRASDDDGEIASFEADTREGSFANESEQGSYYSYSGSGWGYGSSSRSGAGHNSSHAERAAALSTREGDVTVTDGCRRDGSHGFFSYGNGWYSTSQDENGNESSSSGHSSQSEGRSSDFESCGTTATAERDGESVGATAFGSDCARSEAHESSYSSYTYGDESGWSYDGDNAAQSRCASGSGVDLGDEGAWAGYESECSDQARWDTRRYGNSSTSSSWETSECRGGHVVRGPDGIALFLGSESNSWSYCDQYYCDSGEATWSYFRLTWDHNPLGVDEFTYPLP